MRMRHIWRLEDSSGWGVYSGHYAYDATEHEADGRSVERHPNPFNDEKLGYREVEEPDDWYFGFSNLRQYREWFHRAEWRRKLHKLGVQLNRYEIEDEEMRVGEKQAIFIKAKARLVETRRPDFMDKSLITNDDPTTDQ
jgi:hypothetical protein